MTEAGKLKLRVIPSQKRLRAEAIFAQLEDNAEYIANAREEVRAHRYNTQLANWTRIGVRDE